MDPPVQLVESDNKLKGLVPIHKDETRRPLSLKGTLPRYLEQALSVIPSSSSRRRRRGVISNSQDPSKRKYNTLGSTSLGATGPIDVNPMKCAELLSCLSLSDSTKGVGFGSQSSAQELGDTRLVKAQHMNQYCLQYLIFCQNQLLKRLDDAETELEKENITNEVLMERKEFQKETLLRLKSQKRDILKMTQSYQKSIEALGIDPQQILEKVKHQSNNEEEQEQEKVKEEEEKVEEEEEKVEEEEEKVEVEKDTEGEVVDKVKDMEGDKHAKLMLRLQERRQRLMERKKQKSSN